MRLVVRQLARRGHERLGLVLDAAFDERVDRAWLAAFSLHQHDLPAKARVPALILCAGHAKQRFGRWMEAHRPEAVLFAGLPVPEWIAGLGLHVPRDVGLVHLDWSPELAPLCGIDANAEALGAAAVELLVGQLHAHEYGIPRHEKIVAVRGKWVPGKAIR